MFGQKFLVVEIKRGYKTSSYDEFYSPFATRRYRLSFQLVLNEIIMH